MNWIDITIVAAFILYAVFSGLRNREAASQNLEEYFLAGRSLKGWHAGISMAATQFAADTPLLVTGLIATSGIFALWRMWIYAVAFLMMGFLLAPAWRRARVLTDAELTEIRYSTRAAGGLRAVKAIYFGTIFNCTVLAMVLLAATRIAEPFLLWNEWLPVGLFQSIQAGVEWLGVPLTASTLEGDRLWVVTANNVLSIGAIILVTTFYSTTGGLRSVVATDVFQFFIALLASLFFGAYVLDRTGGFSGIRDHLMGLFATRAGPAAITYDEILAFTPSRAKDASWAILSVMGLQWLVQMNADGTGYLAQRSMACRTDQDARQAAVVFTLAQVFLRSLIWLPIGLGLLVIFPPQETLSLAEYVADREFTFVRGIAEVLPSGIKGLMLTGMLAALASTLDTHLNWGASYWTNDIFKRFLSRPLLGREATPRELVWVARAANLLILTIALLILPGLSSLQKAWQISLMLGSGMGVILVLRWMWWRINAWGELACIGASLVLAPLLLYFVPDEFEAVRLLSMAIGSTAAGILASWVTGPGEREHLVRFYQRVRPPGFWGPISQLVNEPHQEGLIRLKYGAFKTLTASFSIFCLLTGVGTALVGGSPPSWFPWQTPWVILLMSLGVVFSPSWWRTRL